MNISTVKKGDNDFDIPFFLCVIKALVIPIGFLKYFTFGALDGPKSLKFL